MSNWPRVIEICRNVHYRKLEREMQELNSPDWDVLKQDLENAPEINKFLKMLVNQHKHNDLPVERAVELISELVGERS